MEEGSGLESLINQRLTRPSYTRMVSWEFSNQQEAIPVKRKRRRSKKQSDVDEEVDISVFPSDEEQDGHSSLTESDEDCLYFSAEETISLESNSADKIHQKIASLDIDETSDKDSTVGDKDSTVGDEDDDSLAGVQSPPQKKHAPSKKQKRKRRKSKNSYVLHAGDFLSAMEMDIEPDIIFDTQELVGESRVYVEKAVPSLVELCLNCTRKRKLNVQLPKGLKNMVKHSNKEFTFRKFQVSWLQNEFSKWQPFEKKKNELFYAVYPDDDDWGAAPVYKCLLPTRNIWNNVFYPKHFYSRFLDDYNGSKTSSFLPFTFVTNPYARESSYDCIHYIFHQRFLGCLANLVDLMMPSILSEKKAGIESDKSELDQISTTTKTAVTRVKGALSVRFRDVTDLFFDKIIPYVFWARGDFHLAANFFTKLIEGEKRSRCRAMYMVEIARMHAQLGEPETASRFYRMAADIALEKGKALKNEKEVTGQMLMLLASVYDQGMMTSGRDRTAADHWRYVVTSGTFNRGAANMAAISMLCFHSRPGCETEPSSFVEARRRLETMVDKCPKYQYYISLLQALAGEESDAENSFKTYKQREQADGAGLSMNTSSSSGNRRKRQYFWQSLSTMISKSGQPQPLHVLWRSHLQPLRVCDPTSHFPPTEADLCCENLDLRLNSQGYLTGNMKLMLPPIRSINLDPYTGKLCFPQTPGSTEVWTTMDRFINSTNCDEEQHDSGFIPCPLEVYRDEDGTTVQMMLPATMEKNIDPYAVRNKQKALTFFWSDGTGQSARLSVLRTFWQLVYEKIGLRFKREALQGKKSEQWLEDCLKVLKFCMDTKRELNYHWIINVVNYDIVEERKEKSKLSMVKFLTSLKTSCLPELIWSRNYTCYGKTLALGFIFCQYNISVFLDCSSRESFLQPEIRLEAGQTHFPDIPNCKNHKLAGGEIYYLHYTEHKENEQHFQICGKKGSVLETIEMEDDGSNEHFPYVVGSSLLIITFTSRLWCWNDYKIKVDEALPPLQKITPTDCSVVMVTVRDSAVFRFVNTPTLDSVPIRTTCNLMDPFQITEDGLEFKAASSDFKVLSTRSRTENDHSFQEVILGMGTNLVTIHILEKDEKGSAEVIITDILPIPGTPVEHCYVGKNDGFLVTWTQQNESDKDYEENLFYFSKELELLSVLPCLGKGPRSFSPLYLPGDPATQTDFPGYGLPGWYVYMRDGHDGIIGVKLPIQHQTS